MIKCQILPGSSFEAVKIRIDLINGATFLTTARLVDLRDKDGEILRCMPSYTIDGLVECVVMRKDTSQATIAYGEHVLRVVANSIVEDSIKDSKENKMSRVKCRILPNNSFNSTVKIRIDLINGILETRVPINALRTFDGEVLRVADQFTSVYGSMECEVIGITSKSTFIKCANHTLLVAPDRIVEKSVNPAREYFKVMYKGSWKNKQSFVESLIAKKGLIDPKFIKLDVYAEALFENDYWCVKNGNGIYVFKVLT